MAEGDATVRELVEIASKYSAETGGQVISFDLEPDEVGDYVLLVVAVGKDARNSIARILNTFLDGNEPQDLEGVTI